MRFSKIWQMSRFRLTLLIIIAVFALITGAFLAVPVPNKNFAIAEINGAKIMVEVAADSHSHALGLAGRESISDRSGMLFLFEKADYYGIWMKDMKFPLDIMWIKNNSIVDLEENVEPPSAGASNSALAIYRPDVPADLVLEVKSGFAKKYNVKIGDSIKTNFAGSSNLYSALISGSISGPENSDQYFIENLRRLTPQGKQLKIEKLLSRNSSYQKFLISYRSGDLTVSGVMNVPRGKIPEGGFPVLILNHGLIHPDIYFSGRGSKREQDFFARRGYITIHPDYRGYGTGDEKFVCDPTLSWTKEGCRHDFYTGYTQDVSALIDALKEIKPKFIDLSRMGMWGHSMGGGMAARVMVLRPEIRAYVLFAPISADVEDNFYELKPGEANLLYKTYGAPGAEIYKKISPLSYFSEVSSPVQLHHGLADKDVPIEFSEKMYDALKSYGKKVEFFKYAGEAHEFGDAWQVAAERALQFFDKYVKEAR